MISEEERISQSLESWRKVFEGSEVVSEEERISRSLKFWRKVFEGYEVIGFYIY